MNKILLYGTVFTLMACCPKKVQKLESSGDPLYLSLAEEKLGSATHVLLNKTGTHVICYKTDKATAQNPYNELHYFIYDIENNIILREENLSNGTIRWLDQSTIELIIIPGMVKKGSTEGKIVKTLDISQLSNTKSERKK
jgi:hypothetical protein